MKLIIKTLTFVLFFLIGLIFIDLYLKQSSIIEPSTSKYDTTLGRIKSSKNSYVFLKEGFSISQFNNNGFRGTHFNRTKENKTLRIVLLGDSWVEGLHVFDRDHFRNLLEIQLSKKLNQNVEVLNFGRAGFDFEDMYILYERLASEFDPDYVVCMIHNDDFEMNSKDQLSPYLYEESDTLKTGMGPSPRMIKRYNQRQLLLRNSSFLKMSVNSYKTVKNKKTSFLSIKKQKRNNKSRNTKHQQYLTNKYNNLSLKAFKNLVHDSCFIFISTENNLSETDFIQNYISDEFTIYPLDSVLTENIEKGIIPFYHNTAGGYGHLNRQGHAIVSDYVSMIILDKIELEN